MSGSALPILTFLATLVAICASAGRVLAEAPPPPHGNPVAVAYRDTLIPAHIPYKGYRLHVREALLLKQRRDRYLVSVTVVNTGARVVELGPGFPVHFLQTAFDGALAQSGLLPLAPGLRQALIDAAVTLEPGASLAGVEFWVSPTALAPVTAGKTDDIRPAYRERLPPQTRHDSAEEVLYASAKPVTPALAADADAGRDDACTDLTLGGIVILQRNKRSALVELTVVNAGRLPLTRERLGTGATLDVYLGGGETVTAASRRLARVNLSTRLGSSLGKGLDSGGRLSLTERVDLAALTRYTRVLVAQLDPGQVIAECDETNNETSLVLGK